MSDTPSVAEVPSLGHLHHGNWYPVIGGNCTYWQCHQPTRGHYPRPGQETAMTDHLSADTDQRVADLDEDTFLRAAILVAAKLETGEGARVRFEPGDATSYTLVLGPRLTFTVAVDMPVNDRRLSPIADVLVTFGTESQSVTLPWGHAARLDRDLFHAWTAAIWRRLYPMISERVVSR